MRIRSRAARARAAAAVSRLSNADGLRGAITPRPAVSVLTLHAPLRPDRRAFRARLRPRRGVGGAEPEAGAAGGGPARRPWSGAVPTRNLDWWPADRNRRRGAEEKRWLWRRAGQTVAQKQKA